MSASIAIIAAGAPASLMEAACGIVAKATQGAVAATPATTPPPPSAGAHAAPVALERGVLIGTQPPRGAYACVVRPPAQPSVHYSAQCPIVVRAVLSPCTHTAALPLRDILDTYHAAGIDITAEVAAATVSIRRAAQLAVREARHRGVSRIALVIKAATKYKNVNGVFTKVATQAIEEAGMSMEIIHTSQASNDLVVFPERHGVVLVNDIPSCENVQLAYAGVTGGAPLEYHVESAARGDAAQRGEAASGTEASSEEVMYGGYSYKSVALALAAEMRCMDMVKESKRIEAAAYKSPRRITDAL